MVDVILLDVYRRKLQARQAHRALIEGALIERGLARAFARAFAVALRSPDPGVGYQRCIQTADRPMRRATVRRRLR